MGRRSWAGFIAVRSSRFDLRTIPRQPLPTFRGPPPTKRSPLPRFPHLQDSSYSAAKRNRRDAFSFLGLLSRPVNSFLPLLTIYKRNITIINLYFFFQSLSPPTSFGPEGRPFFSDSVPVSIEDRERLSAAVLYFSPMVPFPIQKSLPNTSPLFYARSQCGEFLAARLTNAASGSPCTVLLIFSDFRGR